MDSPGAAGLPSLRRPALAAFACSLLFLICRKAYMSHAATSRVHRCWDQISPEAFGNDPDFQNLLHTISTGPTPAIFLLNQYALPMTRNWLCNTANLHQSSVHSKLTNDNHNDSDSVHARAVFVTLDDVAHEKLSREWPNLRLFRWRTTCFGEKFSFGEPTYQVLYAMRSNLAAALAKHNQSFWMMQQDTFWREDIFRLNLEDSIEENVDILFDQVAATDDDPRAGWLNGANFYVKANPSTVDYFTSIGTSLKQYYAPDMGLMVLQCLWSHADTTKCAFVPHKYINCWEWLDGSRADPPWLMQLDCESDNGGKLAALGRLGFHFLDSADATRCNQTAVHMARHNVLHGTVPHPPKTWGLFQFKIYWHITDRLLQLPVLGRVLRTIVPALGFYMLITL